MVLGLAVLFADDHVLGDVDEAPGQVARVRRAQRRVGKSLSGAVGGDEVLEDREALHEVGLDRPLDDFAFRIRHQAAHAGELADLFERAAGARVGHHEDRVQLVEVVLHRLRDLVGGPVPVRGDRLVALLGGDVAVVVLALDRGRLLLVAIEDLRLARRRDDVVLGDRDPGLAGVVESEVLEGIEHLGDRRGAVGLDQVGDHLVDVPLLQREVDELELLGVEIVPEGGGESALDLLVEDDPPDRGREVLVAGAPVLGVVVQLAAAVLVDELGLLRGAEGLRLGAAPGRALARFELLVDLLQLLGVRAVGEVVDPQHHVLRRRRQRRAVGGREDVVGGQHQHPRLGLGLGGERHVDSHLVAVEVGVESVADERVDLDRLALDEDGLEGLDAEAVQGRRPVEQHRVLVDDLLEHVPDLGDHRLDHLFRRLDVLHGFALDQLGHDERLEELERHQLRQAALVQPQARAGDDHRAAGVVDALAEQVLAEAALLALEHVGERLQRPVAGARDRAPATAVVEERIDRLLQHPLLVVDDDLRRAQVEQPFQPVVAVDHPSVQVVEVRGREAAAVELHHRAQLRRDHGNAVEDHPVRLVVGVEEGGGDFQPLHGARLFLAFGAVDDLLHLLAFGLQVDLLEQVAHGLGAHPATEVLAPSEGGAEAVLELTEDRLVVDDVLRLHVGEDLPDLLHALDRLFDVGLGVRDLGVERLAQLFDHLRPLIVLELAQLGLGQFQRVGPDVIVVVELGLRCRLRGT